MSVRLSRSIASRENVDPIPYSAASFGGAEFGGSGSPDDEGVPWARYIDALKRHALLIVAIVMAGSTLGVFAARRVPPVYDVQSTVWIASSASQQAGPI